MKNFKTILFVFLIVPFLVTAQEDKEEKTEKLERDAFESSLIIDNPTNVLLSKNALEVQMQHRFGEINGDNNDLAGFWGATNIRIALSYGIHERLTIGFGTTKDYRMQDFNWKAALLRQTRSNSMPLSVTYYGNFAIDARSKEQFNMIQDRYSFFNQLIIAKRFTPGFSLQVAPSISHYNLVHPEMKNDLFAVAVGGRVKISPQTSILGDFSIPLTKFDNEDLEPKAGISLGLEFATSAHEFQLFLTNYHGIVPQRNYMYNTNDFFDGEFLIGFNITRIYNF